MGEVNAILIGRGDLALSAGYEKLYLLQNKLLNNARVRESK